MFFVFFIITSVFSDNMTVRRVEHDVCLVCCHLERLTPASPERDASSISGVTIFSIISVITVNVGSTMKSMNPAEYNIHVGFIFTLQLQFSFHNTRKSLNVFKLHELVDYLRQGSCYKAVVRER